jgi:hypothetical protein
MICHSSSVWFSFPISGRSSSSAPSSVRPPTATAQCPVAWASSSVAACDRCRRERLAAALEWQQGATEDSLLVTCSGRCCVRPEVLLLATTPTTFSCRRKPLELLLQVRSLLSPSCIFAEVCIYFPVECVGSTIFMDGFFSLNKKLLCA